MNADEHGTPVASRARLLLRGARGRLRKVRPLRLAVARARHVQLSPLDAFVVAYPKSGSTWLPAMVAHLATGTAFSFDTHDKLTPGVGRHLRAPAILPNGGRLLRSHESFDPRISGPYGRVVYMVRDGRDIAVSYFHHFRRRGIPFGSFDAFFTKFLAGDLDGFGPWPDHVRGWLDSPQAREDRLIVVRYEDVVARPEEQLARVARFLDLPADPAAVEATVRLHTADRMRESEVQSHWHARQLRKDVLFVRRATPGEFHEVLTPAQERRFAEVAGVESERLGYPAWPG